MTEEQKKMTLGQVAELKFKLEMNIKDQLIDFMNQTGIDSLQMDGWVETRKQIGNNDIVEFQREANVRLNVINFLNV